MSYFGGLGGGKGWDKFKFVLTPSEFKDVFEGLSFWFIEARRVDGDFQVDDRNSLFVNYSLFFEKLISGTAWVHIKDVHIESGIRYSITGDLQKVKIEEAKDRRNRPRGFKLANFVEPVINVAPFYITIFQENLSISTLNYQGLFGLEFSYPKVVSYDQENHEWLYEADRFSNRKLYDELVFRVKRKGKKAMLKGPNKTFKPHFWISRNCIEKMNCNYYLASCGLRLV